MLRIFFDDRWHFKCVFNVFATQYSSVSLSFSVFIIHKYSRFVCAHVFVMFLARKQAKTKPKDLMLSILYALNEHCVSLSLLVVAFHFVMLCCVVFSRFRVFLLRFYAHTVCFHSLSDACYVDFWSLFLPCVRAHRVCVCVCLLTTIVFVYTNNNTNYVCVWLNFDLGPELKWF